MARATYNFILETSGRDVLDDEVFDALSEAGCDDAGIGRFLGVDHLDFDREAGSFCEAVRSAIEDVQSVPGVNVTRVVPGDDPAVGAAFTEAVNAVLAEAYVWTPDGVKAMTLSYAYLERRLGVVATARNWNTLEKIAAKL